MIRLVCLILLMGGSSLVAQSGVAEGTIDFRVSDNLKAVYDAGFRPWRISMSLCHLSHIKVTVLLPENTQFSLATEGASFGVMAQDRLSSADFIGEVMSVEEAMAKTQEICQALGISTDGLDQAVPPFAERFGKPHYWNQRGKQGAVSLSVTLDLLALRDHFLAKVYVGLDWKHPGEIPQLLDQDVQPPPGYEGESMEMPKPKPSAHPLPEHDLEYYRAQVWAEVLKVQPAAKPDQEQTPAPPPTPAKAPVAAPSRTEFPWAILLLVFLALGSGWGLYRLSKKSGKR